MLPADQLRLQRALLAVRAQFPDAVYEPQSVPESAPMFRCTVDGQPHWVPWLPGPLRAYPLLQAARRASNVYEATHLAWPQDRSPTSLYQALGPAPTGQEAGLPPLDAPPAGIRFETHELRRVPVDVDEQARTWLNRENQQTRLLAQALSEAFGAIDAVERLTIIWRADMAHGPLLEIAALAGETALGRWWLRSDDLSQRHPSREVAHTAWQTAAELARLCARQQAAS